MGGVSRLETIAAFQDSTERALKPLPDVSASGFECETSDGWRFRFKFILCSFVADVLKTKDLPSLELEREQKLLFIVVLL